MQAVQVGGVPAPKARLYSMSRTLTGPMGVSFPPVRVIIPLFLWFLYMTLAGHFTQSICGPIVFLGSGPQVIFFRENRSNSRPWGRGVKTPRIFRAHVGRWPFVPDPDPVFSV